MSGDEHTNNDPAQLSERKESSVDCMNKQDNPLDNKELCDFDGVKSVSTSFFDSSEESLSVYPDALVGDGGYSGDITNWDVGECFGEGLNPVQAVGEVFDIFDTGFQGSEQPEMGNTFTARQPDVVGAVPEKQRPVCEVEGVCCEPLDEEGSKGAHLSGTIPSSKIDDTSFQGNDEPEMGYNFTAGQPDHDSAAPDEQLPVCGGESMGCEPAGGGSKGAHIDGTIRSSSLAAIETVVRPSCDSCHESRNSGDKISNGTNEMTGTKSVSPREVENKTFEPMEVVSWDMIFEVAKQSVEAVGHIPTACDQDMLPHVSEAGEPSRVLNGVACVKSETAIPIAVSASSGRSDIVGENLDPGDKVMEPSPQLHFQKEGPVEDSSQHEHEKHDEDNECTEQTMAAGQVGNSNHDVGNQSGGIAEGKSADCDGKASVNERCKKSLQEMERNVDVVVLGISATDPTGKPHRSRTPFKANEASEKSRSGRKSRVASSTPAASSSQQLSAANSRVLRSKSREVSITPEPIANLEITQGSSVERRGRKKKELKGKPDDEFSKMRKNLRYLVHKISYEQNLLDAYSNEGWRGQSLEKLRPEKELQRAKADINRSKVKIRELFHRLDSMSAEGKFPDSLYDSEGLIDSEDIYCAKCGSKDLRTGNDIILCDGNCDRGFHQYCLDPPLRTEEIPPGDEGWFCPACDCKFDCIDLLNDSQGVKLSIEDSWEKVFPEALAATAGLKQDDILGLPSDDSDDNDYNPDAQDDSPKDEKEESASNESNSDDSDSSDFSSASEDVGPACKDEQYLGLPSDDSEDDDFDPDVKNDDHDDECASSNSDFTSASEDLGTTVGTDETAEHEQSLPVEFNQNLDDSLPLSGRRHVERLDYKKLFDETYGNAASDSSDDDEWTDDVGTTKRKTRPAKTEVPLSANGDVLTSTDGTCPVDARKKRGQSKHDHQLDSGSAVELQKAPQETSSGGKNSKRPPHNRLPESVTQKLFEAFKKNQYPDRSTKEKLAKELGFTPIKVDKWFGNARWSLRHHPSRVEASIGRVLPDHKESDAIMSTPRVTRKRKEGDRELETSKIDTSKENETTAHSFETRDLDTFEKDSPVTLGTRGRVQRKRRKSGA